MHYVIEAQFDELTAKKLALARSQSYQNGFSSTPDGEPHLSISSFQDCDPEDWKSSLATFVLSEPLEVEFSFLGIFSGSTSVVYLGITSTTAIRGLHENIHEKALTSARGLHEHYYPDRIVLHSTIAAPIESSRLGQAIEFVAALDLPKTGMITKLALVKYFPATTMFVRELCKS